MGTEQTSHQQRGRDSEGQLLTGEDLFGELDQTIDGQFESDEDTEDVTETATEAEAQDSDETTESVPPETDEETTSGDGDAFLQAFQEAYEQNPEALQEVYKLGYEVLQKQQEGGEQKGTEQQTPPQQQGAESFAEFAFQDNVKIVDEGLAKLRENQDGMVDVEDVLPVLENMKAWMEKSNGAHLKMFDSIFQERHQQAEAANRERQRTYNEKLNAEVKRLKQSEGLSTAFTKEHIPLAVYREFQRTGDMVKAWKNHEKAIRGEATAKQTKAKPAQTKKSPGDIARGIPSNVGQKSGGDRKRFDQMTTEEKMKQVQPDSLVATLDDAVERYTTPLENL